MASDHETTQDFYRAMQQQAMSEQTPTAPRKVRERPMDYTRERAEARGSEVLAREIERLQLQNDALVTALREIQTSVASWSRPDDDSALLVHIEDTARAALALVEPPR